MRVASALHLEKEGMSLRMIAETMAVPYQSLTAAMREYRGNTVRAGRRRV